MRRIFLALLCIFMFLLAGCSGNTEDSNPAPETAPEESSQAQQEPEAPDYSEIINAFSEISPEEYISVSTTSSATLVSIFEPELGETMLSAYNAGSAPDGWESIQENIIDIASQIEPAEGVENVSVSLLDSKNGTIYLTVINDKVTYNAFNVADVSYNDPTITLDEFNQIANGMTYQQVVEIIGGPGELLSEADLGLGAEYASAMYMWEGEGSIGANANVMFQGGVVVNKAQLGLE